MRKLTECIWYTEPVAATDRPLLAVIRGTDRTLMIDGGNSPKHAESFLDEMRRAGLGQPDFIAITHSHCDHVFGLPSLKGIILADSADAREDRRAESPGLERQGSRGKGRRGTRT